MKARSLSPEQAFRAMFVFLSAYHDRTRGSSELASVLSDIQMNRSDGLTADPAAWDDWLTAVDAVCTEAKEGKRR